MRGLRTCRASTRSGPSAFARGITFGPCTTSRAAASCVVRPASSLPNARSTGPEAMACQTSEASPLTCSPRDRSSVDDNAPANASPRFLVSLTRREARAVDARAYVERTSGGHGLRPCQALGGWLSPHAQRPAIRGATPCRSALGACTHDVSVRVVVVSMCNGRAPFIRVPAEQRDGEPADRPHAAAGDAREIECRR